MKTASALASVDGTLVATAVSRPGKNFISVKPLVDEEQFQHLASNIEFQNGESIQSFKWIQLPNEEFNNKKISKKRRNSNNTNGETVINNSDMSTIKSIDYLVILLTTGEILIYSTFTKEFINKIATDSSFSSIEAINSGKDLIAYDSNDKCLKFFNSTSPQLLNSIPFKNDNLISYIHFNDMDSRLILLSNSSLYILDDAYAVEKTYSIELPVKKDEPEKSISSSSILKIIQKDSFLYVIRTNSNIIQIINLNNLSKKFKILNASLNISDISLINSNKTNIISVTLVDGSIELFKKTSNNNDKSFSRLLIKGGNEVGIFINLLNSSNVIEGVYKGIWYDNFNVQITDFEFEDVLKLKATIEINVNEFSDALDEMIELEDEEDDEEIDDEENDDESNSEQETEDYTCTELSDVLDLIKPKLENNADNEELFDKVLVKILSDNVEFAKTCIYTLSVEQTNLLFNKVSIVLSQTLLSSQLFDAGSVKNIKEWFKWLLILRGSIISKDSNCVEWLKLLQSSFKEDGKKLNNLVKLTGKLNLLKDQLKMRNEIMRGIGGEGNEDDEGEDESDSDHDGEGEGEETTIDGTSVVLDGEGGFDEDDEEDEQELDLEQDHDDADDDDDNEN